jgi:hypothetical protein
MVTPLNTDDMILMHQQKQKELIDQANSWRLGQSLRAQTALSQPRRFHLLLSWLGRLPVRAPRLQPQVAERPIYTRRASQQG